LIGNTDKSSVKKQGIQLKNWFFTYHNYTESDIKKIETIIYKFCDKAIVGREMGESGNTPHLQGCIELKKKRRITELIKLFDPIVISKWLATNNVEASKRYCQKEGDICIRLNVAKPIKVICNLKPWQHYIQHI